MEDYRLKQLIEEQLKYDKAKHRRADSQEDHELARELQNQFNQESNIENPSSLTYETNNRNKDNTKSLVDPSWELIDPTPNIHNLFIAFNQQYFWNKLLAVCVSWSKRMTTCAGICSYQPRAGMCSITLSEPLLKLRPRKDLVETLLHEMIHAFLFVTHNNRDRDGHGPEFHKHMYRINGEAGTNITVYHSFHDEVRLYQQHWWKCNGPCQHQRPFFGMVRRATNRAPGPNDRWWAQHTTNCGGTFVKVKEPEKVNKKTGKENAKPGAKGKNAKDLKSPQSKDIRSFFPVNNLVNEEKKMVNGVLVKNNDGVKFKTPLPVVGAHNVNNLASSSGSGYKKRDNTKIQNINGFKSGQCGSLELKNSETLNSPKPSVVLFNGSGYSLTRKTSSSSRTQDYSAVRNHWLDKFDNQKSNQTNPPKRQKPNEDLTNCPVCDKLFPQVQLNQHLDICLNQSGPGPATSNSNAISQPNTTGLIECDICDEWIESNCLESHKMRCIQNMSTQLDSTIAKVCPICNESLCASLYDVHVASCVMKSVDTALSNTGFEEETVNCLVCKKKIAKNLLNQHLDECMTEEIFMDDDVKEAFNDDHFDEVFDTSRRSSDAGTGINSLETVILDDTNDSFEDVGVNKVMVSCPVCQRKVEESLINTHLDNCLG